jgi:hypothetical protein
MRAEQTNSRKEALALIHEANYLRQAQLINKKNGKNSI